MLTSTRNIVRLLVVDGDFLLLAKVLKKGFFFLPGGGIEYNESLLSAARRELEEELNVPQQAIELIEPIGVYEHSWDDNGSPFHELNVICKCQIEGFHAGRAVESSESHLAFAWVKSQDLQSVDIRPEDFKTLIPQWCASHGQSAFFASSM